MNWNQALFPSLKRRGGCAIKKMSRSNLSSRRRGGQIGEIFRPEEFRRTDHPVCGASEASRLFINAAATPPFQGGECVRTETGLRTAAQRRQNRPPYSKSRGHSTMLTRRV